MVLFFTKSFTAQGLRETRALLIGRAASFNWKTGDKLGNRKQGAVLSRTRTALHERRRRRWQRGCGCCCCCCCMRNFFMRLIRCGAFIAPRGIRLRGWIHAQAAMAKLVSPERVEFRLLLASLWPRRLLLTSPLFAFFALLHNEDSMVWRKPAVPLIKDLISSVPYNPVLHVARYLIKATKRAPDTARINACLISKHRRERSPMPVKLSFALMNSRAIKQTIN